MNELNKKSIGLVAENCSTPTPNLVDQQLQPPPVVVAKDSMVAANIDQNGNDKESPRDEVGDLLERYSTVLHYHDHI